MAGALLVVVKAAAAVVQSVLVLLLSVVLAAYTGGPQPLRAAAFLQTVGNCSMCRWRCAERAAAAAAVLNPLQWTAALVVLVSSLAAAAVAVAP